MLNYDSHKVDIINSQILEARHEIRLWQSYIFNTTYWMHTIMLGFASFVLSMEKEKDLLGIITIIAMVVLSLFYNYMLTFFHNAIKGCRISLNRLEGLLGFYKVGEYFEDGKICEEKEFPQDYVIYFRIMDILVSLLVIALSLYRLLFR